MARSKNIFTRIEKKYRLTEAQRTAIMPVLNAHMQPDLFPRSTVHSIYYDTPDMRLIRTSIEGPVYKEKLRIRCYTTPNDDTETFVELKKKYKGVVYKRRISMRYADAISFLAGKGPIPSGSDEQIGKEIAYTLRFYKGIGPAYALFCERNAYIDREDPNLRLTIDSNLRYRTHDVDLRNGSFGKLLLPGNQYIMEIKTAFAMPLWLAKLLDENKIYPTSFSKYGTAYKLDLKAALDEANN